MSSSKIDRSLLKSSCLLLACSVLATAFVGCGKKDESKPASQVAAKVNADEITVSQINFVLSRSSNQNLDAVAAAKAKSEVLEKLIDQDLAKQQAIALKLDRTPAVVQAIEAARNDILARAYYEKLAGALPKPSADDIKKYYTSHPELFAERRVYSLEEIAVEPKEGVKEALAAQVSGGKSMQDIATWLHTQQIKFSANRGVRAAEALPFEVLPSLQAMRDGEMKLVEVGGRTTIFRLVASQHAPVDEATATPRIQQFLFNQNLSKSLATETKSLRDKADISYVGDFAGGAAAAQERAKNQLDAVAAQAAKSSADQQALARANQEASTRAAQEADSQARALAASRAEQETKQSDKKSEAELDAKKIKQGLDALK